MVTSAVPKVRLPWKATVPVVLVMVVVAVSTVLWNVVPPELVMVRFPMSVPTAPANITAPVVLTVKLSAVPPAVPVTAAILITLAMPVPTVSVTPFSRMALPRVTVPVDAPPTKPLADLMFIAVSESPRVIIPMPAAVIVPMRLIAEGLVAMTPPVKLKTSEPAFPKVSEPLLPKVVSPAMLLSSSISALKAPLGETVMPVLTARLPRNLTKPPSVVSVMVIVLTLIEPVKFALAELVTVRELNGVPEVPIAPLIFI